MVAICLSFMGLFVVMTFSLRAVTLPGAYGSIAAEIPVMPASIKDQAFHTYREEPRRELHRSTPAVLLTTEAFYFGDLEAFTSNFSDVRNKFILRHIDGEPQLLTLIETMDKWAATVATGKNQALEDVLVFVPSGDIPMPIVIQVLAGLQQSPRFKRVILGGGLI
jgi:hypothetical protein